MSIYLVYDPLAGKAVEVTAEQYEALIAQEPQAPTHDYVASQINGEVHVETLIKH